VSAVKKHSDLLDSAFVTLLRNSFEGFVSKLVSSPSLAAERHSKDEGIIVQAQVSSRPLSSPIPITTPDGSAPLASEEYARLDASKIYPVTTRLNHTLSEIIASLDRTSLRMISCIRPNDSCSPNLFDKCHVKVQMRSMLIPDVVVRWSVEFITDFEQKEFCERYVPTMRGSETQSWNGSTGVQRATDGRRGRAILLGIGVSWAGASAPLLHPAHLPPTHLAHLLANTFSTIPRPRPLQTLVRQLGGSTPQQMRLIQ